MTVRHASFGDLERLRGFVAGVCGDAGATDAARDALELAVDEACTNIMEHGYSGGEAGPLTVAGEYDGHEVRISIMDRGRSFSPDHAPPADTVSGWDRRIPGGFGWHLIRSVVDAVEYDTGDDGTNRLTLVKRSRATP